MVKFFLGFFLFINIAYSDVLGVARSFLDENTYTSQRNLVNLLFSKKAKYTNSDFSVNSLLVLKTLKENGLLKFSYDQAQQLQLNFYTKNSPLLTMKIISNILENLGYTYYLSNYISKNSDNLTWSILVNTQNILDPIAFTNALKDAQCKVNFVKKDAMFEWSYDFDCKDANLQSIQLEKGRFEEFAKANRAYWFNVKDANSIYIKTDIKDNWFAFITFFDKDLHVKGQIDQNKDQKNLNVQIPKGVKYIKVEDKFSLDNIKRGISVKLD